ncbi:hypothetical protein A3D62_02050 [Candidatus Kaiserbacteria bacterium RIFCSPHIGHO2_02_FULL_49_11]|uniref:Uncharacterized protein n=1 Tax=Candidatus Kaiserbacteria bacterium RIFCSPHIGHO2_02_FULL_49_11 TaxID=1798489 RepID=A0A1F6CZ91_9BACT|nr:MAG: hypothetical protein A3D62_02050 [Candidatus Kaiserbacteria bacterium RIFCSPHIGHO2_02_FULL_49_11]
MPTFQRPTDEEREEMHRDYVERSLTRQLVDDASLPGPRAVTSSEIAVLLNQPHRLSEERKSEIIEYLKVTSGSRELFLRIAEIFRVTAEKRPDLAELFPQT